MVTKEDRVKDCYCEVLHKAMELFPNGAPSPKDATRLRPFQDLVSAAFLATGLKPETIDGLEAHLIEGEKRPPLSYTPVFLQLVKITSSRQEGEDLVCDMVLARRNGLIDAARQAMEKYRMALTDFLQVIIEDRRRQLA